MISRSSRACFRLLSRACFRFVQYTYQHAENIFPISLYTQISILRAWKHHVELINQCFGLVRSYSYLYGTTKNCRRNLPYIYYPSIGEKLLKDAVSFAQTQANISRKDIEVIFYCRRSLSFHDNEPWIKKDSKQWRLRCHYGKLRQSRAKVCELAKLFMLTELSTTFEKDGLYRLLRLLFNNPKSLCLRFGCFSHHDEEID